jgi:hypothetical protein
MPVPAIAQELFDRGAKLGIKVTRETVTRVIGQNAHEHNGIVLDVVRGVARVGEIFADAMRGFFGGGGTRFGSLDDAREMDELVSLLKRGRPSVFCNGM